MVTLLLWCATACAQYMPIQGGASGISRNAVAQGATTSPATTLSMTVTAAAGSNMSAFVGGFIDVAIVDSVKNVTTGGKARRLVRNGSDAQTNASIFMDSTVVSGSNTITMYFSASISASAGILVLNGVNRLTAAGATANYAEVNDTLVTSLSNSAGEWVLSVAGSTGTRNWNPLYSTTRIISKDSTQSYGYVHCFGYDSVLVTNIGYYANSSGTNRMAGVVIKPQ